MAYFTGIVISSHTTGTAWWKVRTYKIEVVVIIIMFFGYVIKNKNPHCALIILCKKKLYGCVAHNFISLINQSFNIPLPENICCLKAIK